MYQLFEGDEEGLSQIEDKGNILWISSSDLQPRMYDKVGYMWVPHVPYILHGNIYMGPDQPEEPYNLWAKSDTAPVVFVRTNSGWYRIRKSM